MGDGGAQTVQTNEPWEPQQEFLKNIWGQAEQQYGIPMQRFGGERLGPLSAQTLESRQAGLGLIRGAGGGPGGEYLNQLLGGEFLDPSTNPNLRGMAEQGAADITRQFRTAVAPGISMANIGRGGSGAEANRAGQAYRGLGDALAANYAQTYGRNYELERGYQQQGIGLMGQFGANRRADLGFGAQLGLGADIRSQQRADEAISAFDFMQREPGERLDAFQRRIMGGGVLPGITTASGGGGGFTTSQGIGAGLSLLGLFAGGPAGGAVGGAVGRAACSRGWKVEHDTVDSEAALAAIDTLPIAVWEYTKEFQDAQREHGNPVDGAKHIGPYAEDLAVHLGLGDGKTISFIDIVGFALAATKGAGRHIKELAEALGAAIDRIDELEKTVGRPSHLKEVPA